jgi:hypothetical protein
VSTPDGFVDIVLEGHSGETMTTQYLDGRPISCTARLRADRFRFAPERIETREQLDQATRDGVVLRDAEGSIIEADDGKLWHEQWATDAANVRLPALVLYRPDSGERPSGAGDPVPPRAGDGD